MSQISISRDSLRSLIRRGGMCAVPDRTLPMADYVRIATKGVKIRMESSCQFAGVRAYAEADSVTDNVSFCVNAKDLSACIASISDPMVVIDADTANHKIKIVHMGGELSLPCADAGDFSDFELPKDGDNMVQVTIPSAQMSEWIDASRQFASGDDLRPVMCGMRLEANGGNLMCCASDGHLLFFDESRREDADKDFGITIPKAALQMFSQLIEGTDSFELHTDGAKVWVTVEGMMLRINLVEGRYPNVRSVIPANFTSSAKLDRIALLESLKRISLMSPDTTNLVKFSFTGDGEMSITTEKIDFSKSAKETLSCSGDAVMDIGFSCKLLLRLLPSVVGGKAVFRLNGPDKAAVLVEDDDSSRKVILIMPMMLNV